MKKQLAITAGVFLFLMVGTLVVIFYGMGYRFGLDKGKPAFSGTGLLVATSSPDGAEVLINGHLTTATNNTINLFPGEYDVKIFKEGYFPWQKKMKIQKEVVAKADALLLPTTPALEGITSSGVEDIAVDPSFTRIAYTVASQSASKKNGIYVLDMSAKPILTLRSASTQIADDTSDRFSKAKLSWSPDGQQVLATIPSPLGIAEQNPTTYLLSANSLNQNPKDVTATLQSLMSEWEKDKAEKEKSRIDSFDDKLSKVIRDDFKILGWAADDTKILYLASRSADLPIIVTPRLIGTNPTPEERSIIKDSVYVYDIKEDKNYKLNIGNSALDIVNSQNKVLSWYPDSKHLIYVNDKKVNIMDYDGTNMTTVYAGPFVDNYVFPWPNGSKVVILTNLGNQGLPPNLYTIGLK